MSERLPVAAVVVTYFPDADVAERVAAIRAQVARVFVVDNGSPAESASRLRAHVEAGGGEWIGNPVNVGLARALNQGMERAAAAGYEWVVTLDQDSRVEAGMLAALLASAEAPPAARVALVGANTIDERFPDLAQRWLKTAPWHLGFQRLACAGGDLRGVTFVITSGALTSVAAWRALGGFDDGLFIDYIDHDFCLKARRAGYDVRVSAGARLLHNLGAKRVVEVGGRKLRPTFHGATRHYYMARNRVRMWLRHGWREPHWWLFDALFGGLNTVRVLVAEDQRRAKLAAMLRGTWDGLRGRTGERSH